MNLTTTAIWTAVLAISNDEADNSIRKEYRDLVDILENKYGSNSEIVNSINLLELKTGL